MDAETFIEEAQQRPETPPRITPEHIARVQAARLVRLRDRLEHPAIAADAKLTAETQRQIDDATAKLETAVEEVQAAAVDTQNP